SLRISDAQSARRLLKLLAPEEAQSLLKRAGAYQLLMEHFVDLGDFESVARLYEQSHQFDQAALAYERAGKLSSSRKAFDRAKDFVTAGRIRQLEVDALVQRGDRLGAALLLLTAGKREEAAQTLLTLPPSKAFHFLQKAKLDEEALGLGRKEIQRAEA